MNAHELARILLQGPDLPVAVHANGYNYASGLNADAHTHGRLVVAVMHHYSGAHICIGNLYKSLVNAPNWYITSVIHGHIDFDNATFWRNGKDYVTREHLLRGP